ncbi:MAG: hypothetical protein OZ913_05730 [Ignavibacteriaceae bacterium]|nr:MAG: hypothetical protein UZ04_CHB001001796 [Chlorobi bacterium OLB4]MBW7856036.1 hypothetical protein [Ignavibacteria bacterium]MEB2329784.1 hypothetical protein [Ignavibacteriaceae bacterium]OQY77402.1 MAG: hypothetical protein B6D43_07255 [Ignavibacteriales bacterium UTCHB1]
MKYFFLILFFPLTLSANFDPIIITEGDSALAGSNYIKLVSIEYSVSTMFARVTVNGNESVYLSGDKLHSIDSGIYYINEIIKTGYRLPGIISIDTSVELLPSALQRDSITLVPDSTFKIGLSHVFLHSTSNKIQIKTNTGGLVSTINEVSPVIHNEIWFGNTVYKINKIAETNDGIHSIGMILLSEAQSGYEMMTENSDLSEIDLSQKDDLIICKIKSIASTNQGNGEFSICLIRLLRGFSENISMPVWAVEENGNVEYIPYKILFIFDNVESAVRFALENDIANIALE